MSAVLCPHCQHAFDKMPSRKSKCPACQQTVFPRRAPGETEKRLVTEAQAEANEVAWAAHQARASNIATLSRWGFSAARYDEMLSRFVRSGYTDDAHAQARAALLHEAVIANPNDSQRWFDLWRASESIDDPFKEHYPAEWRRCVREEHRRSIRSLRDDLEHRELMLMSCGCEPCDRDRGRVWLVSDRRIYDVLPHVDCARPYGWCGCRWAPREWVEDRARRKSPADR